MKLKLVSPSEPTQPTAAGPAQRFRYWAFLSYSHHDKAIAKKLQKQLETYRVPKRLVGRETSHGLVPARVSPVFRDRDELHAGADLKGSVQEALSRSRWLIVVCTPDSARSPWVNREIIEFKKLHGEGRVLALIARGEPFASDMVGREAEECFPPALRRALTPEGKAEGELLEPIAADMRKQGDGDHRAMLKLVAGMLSVAFDDLVRRDLQRRVRWLIALAASSVVGVVVFAFLAVMAVQARNEAQYQRQQAEGLIEFMLGDLRKKLEPVGRLEVLDSVGEKALGYYAGQDARGLDATALGHRSRAMHLIGEIRDLRGQPAEAQKAFEQAAETTAKLLARAPGDSQRMFDHAQSVFWVGYAAWKKADGKVAEARFREYLMLARRLTELDPASADWRAEVAFASGNVGIVQLGMTRPDEALISFQVAGNLLAELAEERADLRFELANNYGWRANAFALQGDYEGALIEQQHKVALFRSMVDGDKNRTAQRGMLSALYELGMYQLALGRADAAANATEAGLQIADKLVKEDPQNQFWRGDACVARLRFVEVLLSQGNRVVAEREFNRASSCVAEFNAMGTLGFYESLVLNARALTLSTSLVSESRRDALAVQLEQFLDRFSHQLTVETPDRAKLSAELANVALALGELQAARHIESARSAWQRAERLVEPFSLMRDGALLVPLARARYRLGSTAGAQVLMNRIQLTSYRHPAYAGLANELQAARGR